MLNMTPEICKICKRDYLTVKVPGECPHCISRAIEAMFPPTFPKPEPQPIQEPDRLEPSDLPCTYRGAEIAQEVCKPCSGETYTVTVYACDERAKCTLRRYKAGQKEVQCITCRDRVEPKCFLPNDLK